MIVSFAVGGEVGAGQFAAALAVAMPAGLVTMAVSQVLFPGVAGGEAMGEGSEVRRLVDDVTRALTFVMVAGVGVLVIFSPKFMPLSGEPDV